MRRLSTLSFARRLAPNLPDGQKMLAALERPQTRDILETLDRHDHGRFFILAAFQVVKSLIGQLHLARNHALRPRKAGWYGPTDKFQTAFYRDKLAPLLEASDDIIALRRLPAGKPPLSGLRRGEEAAYDRTKYTTDYVTLAGGASHQLLSATTEADRTGRTLEDIYLDEVHLWTHGWIEQVHNRVGDSIKTQTWKELFMSTGLTRGAQDTTGSEAAEIWDTTDQRLWHVRCPACKKLSADRFLHREKPDDPESPLTGGWFYDRAFLPNALPDESRIAATLRWVCPRCSRSTPGARRYTPTCALPDTIATRVALSGTYEHPHGLYISQNAAPYAAAHGWTFTALTVRDALPIVIRWEKAQLARQRGDLEPLAKTIREEFAGIYDRRQETRETQSRPPGGYRMADLNTWGQSAM